MDPRRSHCDVLFGQWDNSSCALIMIMHIHKGPILFRYRVLLSLNCLISFITAVNAFVSNTLYLKFENIVGYPFPFQQNIFAGIVQK
jgi:hypothetical protein